MLFETIVTNISSLSTEEKTKFLFSYFQKRKEDLETPKVKPPKLSKKKKSSSKKVKLNADQINLLKKIGLL